MTKLVNQNTELNEMLNSVGPNESVYRETYDTFTMVEGVVNGWVVTKKYRNGISMIYIPK